jgi:hypothetical protein
MSEFPAKAEKGFTFDDDRRALVDLIFSTLEDAKTRNEVPQHIDLNHLSHEQMDLVKQVYDINPTTYGLKGPYVGIEEPPKVFKRIDAQPFFENGKPAMTKPQDLPVATFDAFSAMAEAMQKDINRPLLINSGYRTSTKQALLFLAYLRLYEYDVPQTAKRVAIPAIANTERQAVWRWIYRPWKGYQAMKTRQTSQVHPNMSGFWKTPVVLTSTFLIPKVTLKA